MTPEPLISQALRRCPSLTPELQRLVEQVEAWLFGNDLPEDPSACLLVGTEEEGGDRIYLDVSREEFAHALHRRGDAELAAQILRPPPRHTIRILVVDRQNNFWWADIFRHRDLLRLFDGRSIGDA